MYILSYNGESTDLDLTPYSHIYYIYDYAFYSNGLTSVEFPSGITRIGDYAFYDNELANVELPNNVITIGDYVFYSNQLTTIEISNSVTAIGDYAFNGNQLTSLIFENGSQLNTIGQSAFSQNQLTNVVIPNRVTIIGDSAFSNNQLTSLIFEDDSKLSAIGANAFSNNQLTSVVIPSGVTTIGGSAFVNNLLEHVDIPESIETLIGWGLFRNTSSGVATSTIIFRRHVNDENGVSITNLLGMLNAMFLMSDNTKIYVPDEAVDVYKQANQWSNSASQIHPLSLFGYEQPYYTEGIQFEVFYNEETEQNEVRVTDYIGTETDIIIPETYNAKPVTAIGNNAFSSNQLTSVEIPNSVTTIGDWAFTYNQLTSVEIPNSVTEIGNYAFGDNKLTDVEIPSSVITIGDEVFFWNQLTSVIIPNSVVTIGNYAFALQGYYDESLNWTDLGAPIVIVNRYITDGENSITLLEGEKQFHSAGENWNTYINENLKIYVPDEALQLYKDSWVAYLDYIFPMSLYGYVQPEFTEGIVFTGLDVNGNTAITTENIVAYSVTGYTGTETDIIIPETYNAKPVTIIDYSAFSNNQLTSVEIPNSVTEIGGNAFLSNQLTSVEIPNSVTTIGWSAFSNNQLTSIIIPNSVTTIGDRAFAGNQLTSVTIPNSVTIIDFAFLNNQLTSVEIPNGVTTIGVGAFSGNPIVHFEVNENHPNFVASYYEYDLENVNKGILYNKNKTTILNYGGGLLKDVTANMFPSSVTTIGDSAFSNNQLTSVVIPNSVTTIGISAFYNNQLTSVVIPNSVTTIGSMAFGGNMLEIIDIPESIETLMGWGLFLNNSLSGVTTSTIMLRRYINDENGVSITKLGTVLSYIFRMSENTKIYVPKRAYDAYMQDDSWAEYRDYIFAMEIEEVDVVWSELEFDYNGNNQTPIATVEMDGEMVELEVVLTQNGEVVDDAVNAGEYVATAVINDDGYELLNFVATFIINKAEITITENGVVTKTYDGTTNVNLLTEHYTVNGVVAGDDVSVIFASAEFNGKNVTDANKVVVSGFELVGSGVNNYDLTTINLEINATITAKEVKVNWSDSEFIYNGNHQSPKPTITLVGGEESALIIELKQNDKRVNEAVNAGDYVASVVFTDSNYVLEDSTILYKINKAQVTLTAVGSIKKEYDGTVLVNIGAGAYRLNGVVAGDVINAEFENAAFNSKNVSEANKVVLSGLKLIGENSENYKLNSTELKINAGITQKLIKITVTSNLRKFKDKEDPELTFTVNGLIEGETLVGALSRTDGEAKGKYKINLGNLPENNTNYKLLLENDEYLIILENQIYLVYVFSAVLALFGGSLLVSRLLIKPKRKKIVKKK